MIASLPGEKQTILQAGVKVFLEFGFSSYSKEL